MGSSSRPLSRVAAAVSIAILAIGCGSGPSSPPVSTQTIPAAVATPPQSASPTFAAAPSGSVARGFAFDPESIVGYYETQGYACTARQASTTAVGHEFQSCQLVDGDGRTRTLGIVTDSSDNVADAFLSLRGSDAETLVEPAAVLEPFAGFLGAVLGAEQGSAQLPWVAAHLGDADARTTVGDLTIATYTPAPDDHTKLTLEIATAAYIEAPVPSTGAQ